MALGERSPEAIWYKSRVYVTQDYNGIPSGTEGINLGQRQGDPVTLLVQLDDGREVRIPLEYLEKIKKPCLYDYSQWKTFPEGRIKHYKYKDVLRHVERVGGTEYELRGFSGKWYVKRTRPDGTIERTKFYVNLREAWNAFDHIVFGG